MEKDKLTYIIVLNYNASQDTIECLDSLLKLTDVEYKILLVDNHSSDNSVSNIKKWIEKQNDITIKIIKNSMNYGYSKGNNIGIKYALNQEDCKNLWILNNDILVDKNSLKELVNADSKVTNETIWGNKVLYENGKIQSLGCRLNKYFMLSYHNYNKCDDRNIEFELKQLDYIHGCSIFFRKSIIKKIGMFPEEYFMFFDDADFSINAFENGIDLNICQTSRVIHKEGLSVKKNNLEYLAVVNRIKFAKKYFSEKIFYVYIGIVYKIFKSVFSFKISLSKKIIYNLLK